MRHVWARMGKTWQDDGDEAEKQKEEESDLCLKTGRSTRPGGSVLIHAAAAAAGVADLGVVLEDAGAGAIEGRVFHPHSDRSKFPCRFRAAAELVETCPEILAPFARCGQFGNRDRRRDVSGLRVHIEHVVHEESLNGASVRSEPLRDLPDALH